MSMCEAKHPTLPVTCRGMKNSNHEAHYAEHEDEYVEWERPEYVPPQPKVSRRNIAENIRGLADKVEPTQQRLDPAHARAKEDDPETSHEAAAKVGDMRPQMRVVLDILTTIGPMTDDRLEDCVKELTGDDDIPWSSYRSARKALVDQGFVEAVSDDGRSRRGNRAKVWGRVTA